MKVYQLIEQLQKLNPEMDILVDSTSFDLVQRELTNDYDAVSTIKQIVEFGGDSEGEKFAVIQHALYS